MKLIKIRSELVKPIGIINELIMQIEERRLGEDSLVPPWLLTLLPLSFLAYDRKINIQITLLIYMDIDKNILLVLFVFL